MTVLAKKHCDLEVYKRAYKLSLEIHRLSLKFPTIEQYAMADQIRRAIANQSAQISQKDLQRADSHKQNLSDI